MERVRIVDGTSVHPPKTRIELHAHLDGCMRHTTIYEFLKDKKFKLPGNGTLEDFKKEVVVREPLNLGRFLAPFSLFLQAVQDDFEALERIAYEFCQDKSDNHVLYAEARYSPYAFLTPGNVNHVNLGEVISYIHKGFTRGEEDFNIKVRSILCTLVGKSVGHDILELFQNHKSKGLVGVDVASPFDDTNLSEEVPTACEEANMFREAKKLGIHRTVHAGERGSADMVRRAVDIYGAERIGHGYRVLEDKYIYKSCIAKNIHFECCPTSSFLTGAVPINIKKHPVMIFACDNANFSINTDDTAVTGYNLNDEYDFVQKWGLTEGILVRTNLNALQASFLPLNEKKALMRVLKNNLGLPM